MTMNILWHSHVFQYYHQIYISHYHDQSMSPVLWGVFLSVLPMWLSASPILCGAQEDLSFNPATLALRVTPTQQCPHICPNRPRAHLARPGLKHMQEALCQSRRSGTWSKLHIWEGGFHKLMCGYDCCECLPWGLLSGQRLKLVPNCSSVLVRNCTSVSVATQKSYSLAGT